MHPNWGFVGAIAVDAASWVVLAHLALLHLPHAI